ncbi:MAG TPA: hypothetical protein VFM75_11255, partial [Modicisalibacter sp.]|nr:hypothetical protein [Modicisalibacter sp.]
MNWFSKLGLKKSLIISMLAVGVLPLVLGSLFVLMQAKAGLERQAFNQLVSIREARGGQVEDYFETIAGQSRTMAETTTVIEAAKAFRSAFHQLPDELDLNQEELAQERETLSEYYLGAFASQYAKINAANIDAQPLIPTDPVSVIAQYRYIADNPNPLGLKDKLDTGADDTAYSRAHAKYHPIFRSFLHEFGFYDVFIVDPETGHIVYSVFKELDFATSLKTGVYSQTNFADAFRAAAEAGQGGEPILVDFAPYKPSYEAAASFISQPVFDGNTLVGVLIFQMPVGRINK